MKFMRLTTIAVFLISACSGAQEPDSAATPDIRVIADARSAPVERGTLVNAAFWTDADSPQNDLILGAAEIGGVRMYSPDGSQVAAVDRIAAGLIAVLPEVAIAGESAPLVVVYDTADAAIEAYRLDRENLDLRAAMRQGIGVSDELTGLCHYRSRLSGSDYLYAVTDAGLIHHYELHAHDGGIAGRLLRTVPSGKGGAFCAVDARDAMLYISEESSGVWRLGAEPESDTTREPVDLRTPFGSLSDDIKGLAIYPVDAETSYLIVSDAGEGRLAVYGLPDGDPLGAIVVDDVGEIEGVAASSRSLGDAYRGGVLAIADEDDLGVTRLNVVAWEQFAAAMDLRTGAADPAPVTPPAVVRPTGETDPVQSFGDAADDPAIWIHPADPSRSLVIGTDKKRGLQVFDLDGKTLQELPDGHLNNADVRYDFPLGGERVDIVAASNRSNAGIAVYRIDAGTRRLVDVADGILPTGFIDPYGSCMYRSSATGEFFVFVNEGDSGVFRQWRLFDNGEGKVAAEQVREFPVGSQSEGCVADDELGHLYIGEEDRGLWKYAAEPDGGTDRTQIDSTGDDGRLTGDVEGVSLWIGDNGNGYLIVSDQGVDSYAVYRRERDNEYVGHFHIVANTTLGVDGASETDGLDVTSAPLGDRYPAGLLVVQDGRNIAPEERQNFKYVSWADVAAVLDLK